MAYCHSCGYWLGLARWQCGPAMKHTHTVGAGRGSELNLWPFGELQVPSLGTRGEGLLQPSCCSAATGPHRARVSASGVWALEIKAVCWCHRRAPLSEHGGPQQPMAGALAHLKAHLRLQLPHTRDPSQPPGPSEPGDLQAAPSPLRGY